MDMPPQYFLGFVVVQAQRLFFLFVFDCYWYIRMAVASGWSVNRITYLRGEERMDG